MAITVDDSISEPTSLGRPFWWTVSSDNVNIVRMKGELDTVAGVERILDPDFSQTNVFTFDFQKLVESNLGGYMTTEEGGHGMPTIDTFSVFNASEAWMDTTPTFTELVSTASGGLVESATLTASDKWVLNAFLPKYEDQNFNVFNLLISGRRFLTNNSPSAYKPVSKRKTRLTDNVWLSAFDTTAHLDLRIQVDVTDNNGAVTTSYLSISDLTTHDRGDIPVGAVQINAGSLAGGSAGSQPIIDSTTKSYDITVLDYGGVGILSETITFEIDKACYDNEVMFYWENRLGGLDNHLFQSEQRGIVVDKKTYTKPLTKDFTNESRGTTTIGGESNNTFTAYTRALTDNELIWLEELFEDRLTYILVGGDFIPVTVTKNSVQTVQDGLVQLSVNYQYANNNIILGK